MAVVAVSRDIPFTANNLKATNAQGTADTAKSTADTAKDTADHKSGHGSGTAEPTDNDYTAVGDTYTQKDSSGNTIATWTRDADGWHKSINVQKYDDYLASGAGNRVYLPSADAPTDPAPRSGDQWYKITDSSTDPVTTELMTYDGTKWISYADKATADVAKTVAALPKIYQQDSAPTGTITEGSTWYKTTTGDDGKTYYEISRYESGKWVDLFNQSATDAKKAASDAANKADDADKAAKDAATAAANAAGIAGGKSVVRIQDSTPGTSDQNSLTLWIDTTSGANTPKRWDGSNWVTITDKAAKDAATEAATAKQTADTAKAAADDAAQKATGALNIANSKRRNFTSQPAPPYDVGDTWTQTGSTYYCIKGRSSGSYMASDWTLQKITLQSLDSAVSQAWNTAATNAANGVRNNLDQLIASGNNLVQDSGFEGSHWGGTVTDQHHYGKKSLKVTATGNISDIYLADIKTNPGRTYYFEAWVLAGQTSWGGSVNIAMSYHNTSSGSYSYPTIQGLPTNGGQTWTKLSGYTTVPDGYDEAIFRLSVRNDVAKGAVFYFDDVVIIDVTDSYAAIKKAQSYKGVIIDDNGLKATAGSTGVAINSSDGLKISKGSTILLQADTSGNLAMRGNLVAGNVSGVNFTGSSLTLSGTLGVTGAISAASGNVVINSSGLSMKKGSINLANTQIDSNGNLTTKNATITGTTSSTKITGGDINIGSGKFHVDSSGNLSATNANIKGTVNASGGSLSSMDIDGPLRVTGSVNYDFHGVSNGNYWGAGDYQSYLDGCTMDGTVDISPGSQVYFIHLMGHISKAGDSPDTYTGDYGAMYLSPASMMMVDYHNNLRVSFGPGGPYYYSNGVVEADNNYIISADKGNAEMYAGNTLHLQGKSSVFNMSSNSTGDYLSSQSTANNHTSTSGSANLKMTASGGIYMLTSASKYKEDIEYDLTVADAKKILNVRSATWHDKRADEAIAKAMVNGEINNQNEDLPYLERVCGFVAEDIEDAGMNQLVEYGNADAGGNRKPNGVKYDRIPVYHNLILRDHEQEINLLKTRVTVLETILKQKGIVA